MAGSVTVTQNDLLEALREAMTATTERPEGAIRVEELAEATGHCAKYVRDYLRPMLASGTIECVQVPYVRMDGKLTRVSAYRLRA